MKLSSNYPLFIIVFIAAIMRIYQFGNIPNGVNRDEASIGYTAKLLMETGADEHGVKWPLKFESFGDWKQPLYIYASIPFVWIFGLSSVSVRALSLISGLLMIIIVYMVPKERLVGIVAALFLALNPWHFHFSHLGVEAMLAASLIALGIKYSARSVGVVCLLLSLFTYHAAIIVVPLWFVWYLSTHRMVLKNKWYLIVTVLFFIVVTGIVTNALGSDEKSKVTGTTIFSMNSEEQWQAIYQYRTSFSSKLLHNQYVYFAKTIASNYLRAFSPEFLLFKGGSHPHYNVPGIGNFLVVEIIFLVLGVWWIVKTKNSTGFLFVAMVLIAPLAGAITRDGVHSTRDIFMLPAVQILAAYGFVWVYRLKNKIMLCSLVIPVVLVQAIPFYYHYWNTYPVISNQRFSGNMREISTYLKEHHQEYQTIYITFPFESPYIFYAFYNQLDPKAFKDTIRYYSTDSLGFRYSSHLLNMEYPASTKEAVKLLASKKEKALIIAHKGEISGQNPITSWDDIVAVKIDSTNSLPQK